MGRFIVQQAAERSFEVIPLHAFDVNDLSELSCRHPPPTLFPRRVKQLVMSHTDKEVMSFCGRDHLFGFSSVYSKRFFHVNVCASSQALKRQRSMGVRWRGEVDNVRPHRFEHPHDIVPHGMDAETATRLACEVDVTVAHCDDRGGGNSTKLLKMSIRNLSAPD
jgi:hypothetical protein